MRPADRYLLIAGRQFEVRGRGELRLHGNLVGHRCPVAMPEIAGYHLRPGLKAARPYPQVISRPVDEG